MFHVGKILYSYISRPSVRLLSSFQSTQNPVNLYPNSDANAVFKKPVEPSINQESFSGYIPLNELQISYMYSGGPGGQHVNKNKTKVEVRFHVPSASWIPEKAKQLLMERVIHICISIVDFLFLCRKLIVLIKIITLLLHLIIRVNRY
ncbi:unnamed protein product [Trichobilharzia szidati]|nr:unnamed protein product [Trichobilharzia szidati]